MPFTPLSPAVQRWKTSLLRLRHLIGASPLGRIPLLHDLVSRPVADPQQLFGMQSFQRTFNVPGALTLHEHAAVRSPIVSLHDCVLDRRHLQLRRGGDEIPPHPFPEALGFALIGPGALQLAQPLPLDPARLSSYQRQLLSLAIPREAVQTLGDELLPTFVVERGAYANLYHTLIELFNTYLSIRIHAPDRPFNLLWLDGHCRGALDPIWAKILHPNRILRLADYPEPATRFQHLVLVPGGYDSPLFDTGPIAPSHGHDALADFIKHVLAAYGIQPPTTDDRVLTFVDRRDARAHPHSNGVTDRKVADLDHTISLLQRLYPHHRVQVHAFEHLAFGEQLRIVHESDILCGVHGAALSLVLFMRPGTQLVEFRPAGYQRNRMFEYLAGYRSVTYRSYFAETTQILPDHKLIVTPTNRPC